MKEAINVYWLGWFLVAVTFGLAYPWYAWRRHQFRVNNSRFGTSSFSFLLPSSEEYWSVYVPAGLLSFIVGVLTLTSLGRLTADSNAAIIFNQLPLLFAVLFYYAYIKVGLTNILFGYTKLGEHRFISTLKTLPLFWIYLSNILIIILSVGLLTPWAMIRAMRYRAANLQLLAVGDLSDFTAEQQQDIAAIGEEVGEFVDMDLGL